MTWKPAHLLPEQFDRIMHLSERLRASRFVRHDEETAWLLGLADMVKVCVYPTRAIPPSIAYDIEARLCRRLAIENARWEWEMPFQFDAVTLSEDEAGIRLKEFCAMLSTPRSIDGNEHDRLMREAQE